MSEPLKDEAEVLDGLPVLSGEPSGVSAPAPSSRALGALTLAAPVQAAAAAVGGFAAGAVVVGLVRRHHGKRQGALATGRSARRLKRSGKRAELVQVVASRSLLVDVHLLGSPGSER